MIGGHDIERAQIYAKDFRAGKVAAFGAKAGAFHGFGSSQPSASASLNALAFSVASIW
jgi:hypothetical protein